MELSLREAATLIGRSSRTLRAQLSRGEIVGTKRNGHWTVDRHALPMTDSQRLALQSRADAVRDAVESALPSRLAERPGQRRKSVADLDAFRHAKEAWIALRQGVPGEELSPSILRAGRLLERGLLSLAEATHAFDVPSKRRVLRRARSLISRAVGHLLLSMPSIPPEPLRSIVVRIETEVLPAIGGLLRWTERLERRRP